MAKQKKQKPIVGWMRKDYKKVKGIYAPIVTDYKSFKIDSIQVIILPLADYKQRERDHEARLEYAAMELAGSVGNKKHQLPYKEWLKRLRSITADKDKVK